MLIDHQIDRGDVGEVHSTLVHASAEECWRALRATDFRDSRLVRVLFRLRGLSADLGTIDSFVAEGFELVAEDPPRELVLGLAGGMRARRLVQFPVPAGGLGALDAPGVLAVAWNFSVEAVGAATSRVRTETRVRATSRGTRAAFRAYWLVVGPFSALIRRRMLVLIKREAERTS